MTPATTTETAIDIADLLDRMVEVGGSDLLLKVSNHPLVRVRGELRPLNDDDGPLAAWQTEHLLYTMMTTGRIKEFETNGEIDFAYSAPGIARFRVSGYRQRGSVSIVMRVVPAAAGTVESLGLPEVLKRLAEEDRGLILVTGGTGSGKSTTLAAMVGHINDVAPKHIVTIEDPIEYLHSDRCAAIDQREIGSDTESFANALRRVLRQDPDVILIGEVRDEETVRAALAAAETGHLVLSTLHTLDAAETINRIIDFFQPHEHQHVRAMLAGTLKGIVSQRLAPAVDGQGRVAICEIITMTGRVHDTILDSQGDIDLGDIIAEGEYYGMQSFDQALFQAMTAGRIDLETALRVSSNPHDFKLLVSSGGHLSTSMEHLEDRVRVSDAQGTGSPTGPPPGAASPDEGADGAERSNGFNGSNGSDVAHAEPTVARPSEPAPARPSEPAPTRPSEPPPTAAFASSLPPR
jgi:twitching motility protein PilT